MMKIRVSCSTDDDLKRTLEILSPIADHVKVSNNREGGFRKAYFDVDPEKFTVVFSGKT